MNFRTASSVAQVWQKIICEIIQLCTSIPTDQVSVTQAASDLSFMRYYCMKRPPDVGMKNNPSISSIKKWLEELIAMPCFKAF